jgi:hypothetical protein
LAKPLGLEDPVTALRSLDLKVRRVLKTNPKGRAARAYQMGELLLDSVIEPLPSSPSSGFPGSKTAPGSGSSKYPSRGTKK